MIAYFGALQGDDCHSLFKRPIAEHSQKMSDIIK